MITTGIQSTLLRWREEKVIQDSAWDRLAQFPVLLQRISSDKAVQLVGTRLKSFLEPFSQLPQVVEHLRQDPLFPLGQAWSEQYLRDKADLRPRDVINLAGEGWRELQEKLRQPHGIDWLNGATPQDNGTVGRTTKTLSTEELRAAPHVERFRSAWRTCWPSVTRSRKICRPMRIGW